VGGCVETQALDEVFPTQACFDRLDFLASEEQMLAEPILNGIQKLDAAILLLPRRPGISLRTIAQGARPHEIAIVVLEILETRTRTEVIDLKTAEGISRTDLGLP
jgi:hypothetical protein